MRKTGYVLLTALFMCSLFLPLVRAEEALSQLVERIAPSTVIVFAYDEKGTLTSQGSGFFVSKSGHIITARHVLFGAHRARAKTSDGKVYQITKIVAEDERADLVRAVVDIPEKLVRPLPVGTSIPKAGERIVVVGSPLGLEQTVSEGIVSAVREIPGFGTLIQITAPLSPGSSGSPVVNMQGEVVGVATFQITEGQNLNFAIPGEWITRLQVKKGKSLQEWWGKARGKEPATAEEPFQTGFRLFLEKKFAEALPYFEEAAKENPDSSGVYPFIGECNFQLRRYQEAIEAFKQAIRINPDFAEAHYSLGLVYVELGDKSSALEAYKILKNLDSDLARELFNSIYE